MSRASSAYFDALSTLLDDPGERPISDVHELRPRDGFAARLEELDAIGNPIEAAALCLQAVWHEEMFRSSLFCVQDVDTGESVVVYASGPEAERALLSRDHGDVEPTFTAGCVREPFVLNYSDLRPRVRRHRFLPTVGEVLVAPVMSFGRCIGTFELLGRGPTRFSQRLARTLGRAAARYAQYLDAWDVVLGFSVGECDGAFLLSPR